VTLIKTGIGTTCIKKCKWRGRNRNRALARQRKKLGKGLCESVERNVEDFPAIKDIEAKGRTMRERIEEGGKLILNEKRKKGKGAERGWNKEEGI